MVIARLLYKQHRFNADNVRQDRALSVEAQEIIHSLTGTVLSGVNLLRDTSTMILLLNDIIRGEYAGRIVYKRTELVEHTDTEEKRLKFLFAWLSKHQRRIIGYSNEFYTTIIKVLDTYLQDEANQEAFAMMPELHHEVLAKYHIFGRRVLCVALKILFAEITGVNALPMRVCSVKQWPCCAI